MAEGCAQSDARNQGVRQSINNASHPKRGVTESNELETFPDTTEILRNEHVHTPVMRYTVFVSIFVDHATGAVMGPHALDVDVDGA